MVILKMAKESQNRDSWASQFLQVTMETLGSQLNDVLIQKLFRIFLLFTEESSFNGDVESASIIKHHIHEDEAQFIISLIAQQLSPIHRTYDIPKKVSASSTDPQKTSCWHCTAHCNLLTFKEFVEAVGDIFPIRDKLEPAIGFVYDQLVNQLLKKGLILKKTDRKGFLRGESWKIAALKVFPGRMYIMQFSKGQLAHGKIIILNKQCSVSESKSDAGKWFWSLKHAEKVHNFASTDLLDRQQWISTVELAISKSEDCGNFHRNLFCKRKLLRRTYPGSCECSTGLSQLLKIERNSRILLESERKQLQESLELEHQAVKDEGIVRNIAARMFEEERLRREHIEVLHADQTELLRQEQECRRRAETEEQKRSEELRELRAQLEELKRRKDKEEGAFSAQKIRSSSTERKQLINELKRDQMELMKYQKDLQSKSIQHSNEQNEFFREIGGALERLVDKSQKRHSVTDSMINGSARHIDKIIYTPSRSSSESS